MKWVSWGLLALSALPLTSSGCLTPAMWNAYTEDEAAIEPGPASTPERLERAVRVPGGDIHLETLFADGETRHHGWNAVLGDLRPMEDRPRAMVELRSLLTEREPRYALADLDLDTETESPDELARSIGEWALG